MRTPEQIAAEKPKSRASLKRHAPKGAAQPKGRKHLPTGTGPRARVLLRWAQRNLPPTLVPRPIRYVEHKNKKKAPTPVYDQQAMRRLVHAYSDRRFVELRKARRATNHHQIASRTYEVRTANVARNVAREERKARVRDSIAAG